VLLEADKIMAAKPQIKHREHFFAVLGRRKGILQL